MPVLDLAPDRTLRPHDRPRSATGSTATAGMMLMPRAPSTNSTPPPVTGDANDAPHAAALRAVRTAIQEHVQPQAEAKRLGRRGEKLSNLEQPIAVGRTAEVYPFEDGQVLKLFFPTICQLWIDKEVDTGRYIQGAQLPVPKVFERVRLDDREGVVYERIEGPSLLDQLALKPWKVVQSARLLANLHAQVHKVPAPSDLETQREWARGGIPETEKLSKALRESVLDVLDSMPDGNQLCHGDFHPGNVLVARQGPVIIDWMTASKGTACGDVARTSIILEAAQVPEGTPMRWLLEWIRKLFLATYLKTYSRLRSVDQRSFTAWRAIMAANFLADVSLPEEETNLIAIVEHGIGSMEGG